MSRRLRTTAGAIAVCGVLAGAAIANAASSSTTARPSSPRPHLTTGYQSMPAASHKGNCPNMGGSSSGSGASSDSGAPSASGV
jgi:hypothetical protein